MNNNFKGTAILEYICQRLNLPLASAPTLLFRGGGEYLEGFFVWKGSLGRPDQYVSFSIILQNMHL